MAYKVETRLKCLKCGFGLFLEQKNEPSVECPRCKAKYNVLREDDEISIEEMQA